MHSYRPAPVLEALGVCSEDEQLYRALLARPESTATDLAALVGWPAHRVSRHLRSLLSLGLASRTPGRPARYVPAVPEAAVELLALRKQAAIVEARLGASVLTAEFRQPDAFTVIRGAEAIAQRFYQAQQCAQDEVLVLDRLPYALLRVERGVSYRTIYDMATLAEPGDLVAARSTGCRMLRDVPLQLLLVDRRAALLPTAPDVVVELGPSSLLDALLRLFDLLWHQASPLTPALTEGPLTSADQQLLSLAAAGLTDQAIARRLGVAQRTVERRMQRILRSLDATTRFQAGLRAGQQGLLA
ncbi:helix-turn-helix domain-containing protein [Kribbella solani]|uniref:DNA-binding CsgD family transcriptional regulator n=1 Tax=Kribbella solani TaxID=236067 RepID=A0A841DX30_9ACTN|nr:helix-turn-helix domain-containing protein [Kribbella solani]MBB5981375.1 DNA-binding CsgD family transcriptional regulator [Kribbella solani]